MGSRAASGSATVGTVAEYGPHTIIWGHHLNHPGGGGPAGRLGPGSLDTNMPSTVGAPGAVATPDGARAPTDQGNSSVRQTEQCGRCFPDSICAARPSRGAWGTGGLRWSRTHGPQTHPRAQGKEETQGCAAKCLLLWLSRERSAPWQPAQDSVLQTPSDLKTSFALEVNLPCPGQSSLSSHKPSGRERDKHEAAPTALSLFARADRETTMADHTPGWPTHDREARTRFRNAGPQALGSYAQVGWHGTICKPAQ